LAVLFILLTVSRKFYRSPDNSGVGDVSFKKLVGLLGLLCS